MVIVIMVVIDLPNWAKPAAVMAICQPSPLFPASPADRHRRAAVPLHCRTLRNRLREEAGEGFALDPLGPAAPDPDSLSNGF
jgi:hypothetical protein